MSSKDIIPVENEKATEKDFVDDKTQEGDKDKNEAGWSSYRRIFAYTDRIGWILNFIAFIAAICSGALLPLMNLVFGKTITTFTDFGTGRISPDKFRSQTTSWTLWFIYLFLGKFCLTYIWTVALNISALRTTKSLRIDFLRQALRQDIAFFDQSSNGAIAIQITTNGNLVNVGIAEKLGLAVQGLATFVAAFAVVCMIFNCFACVIRPTWTSESVRRNVAPKINTSSKLNQIVEPPIKIQP